MLGVLAEVAHQNIASGFKLHCKIRHLAHRHVRHRINMRDTSPLLVHIALRSTRLLVLRQIRVEDHKLVHLVGCCVRYKKHNITTRDGIGRQFDIA